MVWMDDAADLLKRRAALRDQKAAIDAELRTISQRLSALHAKERRDAARGAPSTKPAVLDEAMRKRVLAWKMRIEGKTFREIGAAMNVSASRAAEIYRAAERVEKNRVSKGMPSLATL